MSGSREGLLGGANPPAEFSSEEINVCIAQSEERYSKDLSPLILKRKTCHGNRDRPGRSNRHSSFRNRTGYQMQGTRSRVDSLAPVIKAEVVETVASLLRRCPSLARDFLSRSDLSGRS